MTLEPGKYIWRSDSGNEAEMTHTMVAALALIHKHFPGAKAKWWRVPGEKWKRT